MTVEFTSLEHANVDTYLLRWFESSTVGAIKETAVPKVHIVTVSATRYQIHNLSIEKPTGYPSGTLFTVTVTAHNSQGDSPTSAPSAPFTIAAPLTVAPSDLVVSLA